MTLRLTKRSRISQHTSSRRRLQNIVDLRMSTKLTQEYTFTVIMMSLSKQAAGSSDKIYYRLIIFQVLRGACGGRDGKIGSADSCTLLRTSSVALVTFHILLICVPGRLR